MPSNQEVLRYPIRKTRNASSKLLKEIAISGVATRSANKLSEKASERNLTYSLKFENNNNTNAKPMYTQKEKATISRLTTRRNLNDIFDAESEKRVPDSQNSTDNHKAIPATPCKSPKKYLNSLLSSPLKSLKKHENSLLSSPLKSPKKHLNSLLSSPLKSPKRKPQAEQLNSSLPSPPKRCKENDQENCSPQRCPSLSVPATPNDKRCSTQTSPSKRIAANCLESFRPGAQQCLTPGPLSTDIADVRRTALTSPPKNSKGNNFRRNIQPRRCLTPIALFKQNVSSYQAAKQALHTSTPTRMVGRDRQLKDLQEFLEEHLIAEKKPGCLYISGAPGTGKTACLTQILQEFQENHSFASIFINCMTVRNSSAIFEKIATSLGSSQTMTVKENVKYIERMLCKGKDMVVLVLDEMDQLSTKNQQVLYSVFEWPRLPKSNLLLIGIANALDMTDRILPRLHACGCQPTLLNFPPYSQAQITAILQDRLNKISEKEGAVIKPAAIQFCARKIAAQTGDVRKALDTCRRAVELVENKVKSQQVLRPTCDDGSNPGSPRRSPRKLDQAVDMSQIMGVLHEIYGSKMVTCSSKQSELQSSMPIQQKLLLCTLLLLTRHKFKGRDLTLGKFHEVHTKVCRIHKVESVASMDFQSMCLLAESSGLVQIKNNKEMRLSKIVLKVDEDEVQFVMKDKDLLAAVLSDKSVLN